LPHTYKNSQEINQNDFLVVNDLNEHFTDIFTKMKKASHRKSLENEVKRLEDLEIKRLQEIERKKEEKRKRKEELLRLKKENDLRILKELIQTELINNMELNDEPGDICDIYNFHRKTTQAGKYFLSIFVYFY
jgi:hypothetical protein